MLETWSAAAIKYKGTWLFSGKTGEGVGGEVLHVYDWYKIIDLFIKN